MQSAIICPLRILKFNNIFGGCVKFLSDDHSFILMIIKHLRVVQSLRLSDTSYNTSTLGNITCLGGGRKVSHLVHHRHMLKSWVERFKRISVNPPSYGFLDEGI